MRMKERDRKSERERAQRRQIEIEKAMFDNILVPANEHRPENHTTKRSYSIHRCCCYISFLDYYATHRVWKCYCTSSNYKYIHHKIVCLYHGNDIPRMNLLCCAVRAKANAIHNCNIAQNSIYIQKEHKNTDHKWF